MKENIPPTGVDLHVHSVYSDGLHTPRSLCEMAARGRLTHVALCDHDTLEGIRPMAWAVDALNRRGGETLRFLPGVELSAGAEGTVHVLGYGADPENGLLAHTLETAALRRKERFQEMLARLSALGLEVPPEFFPPSRVPWGRAHLARALVQMGAVRAVGQAFDRYLAEGRPAYVPYRRLSAAQAVELLRSARTVPVLAHPQRMRLGPEALRAMVQSLRDVGLAGLEVFHPSASRRDIRMLEPFARGQGLLVTGGSDFHGDVGWSARMGRLPPGWIRRREDVDLLMKRMADA